MAQHDPEKLIAYITGFINSVGISCTQATLPEDTFLPGIEIRDGGIFYDPERLKYPGDLLHEAGHIAVLLPAHRPHANPHNINGDLDAGGAEMGAIAWSWAALQHLQLEPEVLFHELGYNGSAESLLETFSNGNFISVGLLQWMGMTIDPRNKSATGEFVYPNMRYWLRPAIALH